jgi:hypothetical protein
VKGGGSGVMLHWSDDAGGIDNYHDVEASTKRPGKINSEGEGRSCVAGFHAVSASAAFVGDGVGRSFFGGSLVAVNTNGDGGISGLPSCETFTPRDFFDVPERAFLPSSRSDVMWRARAVTVVPARGNVRPTRRGLITVSSSPERTESDPISTDGSTDLNSIVSLFDCAQPIVMREAATVCWLW